MIVISDTTPIISLLKIGRLELLEMLFTNVKIPQAVYNELTNNVSFGREAGQIKECSYIEIVTVKDLKSINIFRRATGLDAGESEAIVLAEEIGADLLLMDERKGRRIAKQMGLTITGTIGILLSAFQENILSDDAVIECMDTLKASGIRVSNSLYGAVIEKMKSVNNITPL